VGYLALWEGAYQGQGSAGDAQPPASRGEWNGHPVSTLACDRQANRIPRMGNRSAYRWFNIAYVGCIASWLLLRAVFMDRWWLLALVYTMAVYLFVPLPILLFIGLIQRRKDSLWLLTLPGLAFMVLYGELFLPRMPGAEPIQGPSIGVMSFNLHFRNDDMEGVAEAIRSAYPGIVGFQELTAAQGNILGDLLSQDYPYRTPLVFAEDRRIGLFSRYPIQSVEGLTFARRQQAMRLQLEIEGQSVYVYVAHLSPTLISNVLDNSGPAYVSETYTWRAEEASRLAESVSALDEPVILLCDCNLTDTSYAYSKLEAVLEDSFREAGWGFGHTVQPEGFPFRLQRIDFIWHSSDFVAIRAGVGPDGGSDHRPVTATLKLRRPASAEP